MKFLLSTINYADYVSPFHCKSIGRKFYFLAVIIL